MDKRKILSLSLAFVFYTALSFSLPAIGAAQEPSSLTPETTNTDEFWPPAYLDIRGPESYLSVPGDVGLDPTPGATFVVSFLLYFDRLPKIGVRQIVLSKYLSSAAPYPGWAIAVQRYPTSVRAELYLRDDEGRGGWFTFDTIELRSRHWYAVTAIVHYGQYVNFFFGEPERQVGMPEQTPVAELPGYSGGTSVAELELNTTESNLVIGAVNAGRRGFRGKLAELLIAKLPSSDKLRAILARAAAAGSADIAAALPAESVTFRLQGELKDESRFVRELTKVGKIRWSTAESAR